MVPLIITLLQWEFVVTTIVFFFSVRENLSYTAQSGGQYLDRPNVLQNNRYFGITKFRILKLQKMSYSILYFQIFIFHLVTNSLFC